MMKLAVFKTAAFNHSATRPAPRLQQNGAVRLERAPIDFLFVIRQRRIYASVRCVFDPGKDELNRKKHGVSLSLAELLFAGPHATMTDDRFDYGEVRQVAFGRINGRLFACVYVDRAGDRRVVSLRKANHREVKRFGEFPE
jgi:hypothetical protein